MRRESNESAVGSGGIKISVSVYTKDKDPINDTIECAIHIEAIVKRDLSLVPSQRITGHYSRRTGK